jgi:L-fuculose-phosphate aldolase
MQFQSLERKGTMEAVSRSDISRAGKDFGWASRRALHLGLQASTGGNISIRIGPDLFLTKPTGMGLSECLESDLVLVDSRGRPLKWHTKPTKEVDVHLAVYQIRPDVGAIVHYHAPHATAYAVKNLPLPLPTLHAKRILKHVPLLDAYPEGSARLAAAAARAFENKEVLGVLMADHGLLAVGPNLKQAQYMAELMEESARIDRLSHGLT